MNRFNVTARSILTFLLFFVLLTLPIFWISFRMDKDWKEQMERSYVSSMVPTYRDFRLP